MWIEGGGRKEEGEEQRGGGGEVVHIILVGFLAYVVLWLGFVSLFVFFLARASHTTCQCFSRSETKELKKKLNVFSIQ